jgi:hypothetical protein
MARSVDSSTCAVTSSKLMKMAVRSLRSFAAWPMAPCGEPTPFGPYLERLLVVAGHLAQARVLDVEVGLAHERRETFDTRENSARDNRIV